MPSSSPISPFYISLPLPLKALEPPQPDGRWRKKSRKNSAEPGSRGPVPTPGRPPRLGGLFRRPSRLSRTSCSMRPLPDTTSEEAELPTAIDPGLPEKLIPRRMPCGRGLPRWKLAILQFLSAAGRAARSVLDAHRLRRRPDAPTERRGRTRTWVSSGSRESLEPPMRLLGRGSRGRLRSQPEPVHCVHGLWRAFKGWVFERRGHRITPWIGSGRKDASYQNDRRPVPLWLVPGGRPAVGSLRSRLISSCMATRMAYSNVGRTTGH